MDTELNRRHFLYGLATLSALSLLSRRSQAADVAVPISIQSGLTQKIASYDRNFGSKAHDTAKVLVVTKAGDADRIGQQMIGALAGGKMAGLPVVAEAFAYGGASALAGAVASKGAAVIYLPLGLEGDVGAIAGALSGVSVITVGASGYLADHGSVVGFELVEGSAKIVINRGSAKAQNVDFRADLLKLARLV